jgi:CubicO group peptidase (beta-lactamase class C family)
MPLRCRTLLVVSLFAWVLARPVPAAAAESVTLPTTFDVDAIDAYVARQAKDKGIVGLSLAILRDGKVVLARGYGKASLETGTPVGVDTPFPVGSVTKQFTAAAILLLAEEGKLSVHDKVAKYYPDLTEADDITLYDLMTHASGYPDYYPLDFVDRRLTRPIAADEVIKQYATGKLDFEPGTRWSYSNTGYIILGRVVEKVSGESLGKFFERRLLKPAGMAHSAFEPKEGEGGLARGYTAFALGDPEPAPREANGWLGGAGGLCSTATDLAKWDLALIEGRVLKPSSCHVMTAPRKLANGKVKEYGCGLGIAQRNGEVVLWHGGEVSGYLAHSTMVPRTRSAVILLANDDHVDTGPLHTELLTLLLRDQAKQEAAVPKVPGPAAKDVALDLFRQMQAGKVERGRLGADFNEFLTDDKVRGAAGRLKALGEPTKVEVEEVTERGGMEATRVRFTFKNAALKAYLYRTPDGKVQEFLLHKG